MRCPRCQSEDLRVIDSRNFRAVTIRRRRECNQCHYRFTTVEEVVRESGVVLKRDGSREPFSREKLAASLAAVMHKRPVTREELNILIIEALNVLELEYDNEVPTIAIAEEIMRRLKGLDAVAYTRYASNYLNFAEPRTAPERRAR